MRERNDHVMSELVDCPQSSTGKTLKITSPSKVLPIHTVRELHAQLDHYSRGGGKMPNLTSPDSAFARKFYVEKIRPALRYYCKKFGVKVPAWLADDDHFKNLPDAEKVAMFGTHKLNHQEFQPLRQPPPGSGTVTRG